MRKIVFSLLGLSMIVLDGQAAFAFSRGYDFTRVLRQEARDACDYTPHPRLIRRMDEGNGMVMFTFNCGLMRTATVICYQRRNGEYVCRH